MELPAFSFPATFLFLCVVMILRYFVVAGSFYLFTKNTKSSPIENVKIPLKQKRRDIYWSIISSIVFAFFGAILIHSFLHHYTMIYFDLSQYGLWYLPVSFFLYLFLHDTYFYWMHRLLHKPRFIKLHFVHHESRVPTAWTSFAFHPTEALLQAIILPVFVFLIPIHWSVLVLFLTTMSLCGVLNHLGYELYPLFFERKLKLISASHHQLHHGKMSYNYGLYFTFWDEWMKTEWKVKS